MSDDAGSQLLVRRHQDTVGEILRRTQTGCQKMQGDRRVGTAESAQLSISPEKRRARSDIASEATGLSRETMGTSASSARTRTRRVSGGSSGAWSRAASRSGVGFPQG
jgi:hypothetical protein